MELGRKLERSVIGRAAKEQRNRSVLPRSSPLAPASQRAPFHRLFTPVLQLPNAPKSPRNDRV